MNTYTVQSGDTLTTIARKTLGNGNAWQLLAEQNDITNPSAIRVGQVLRLPATDYPPKTYRVQRGDTLSAIARRTLGNSNRWGEIAKQNGINNARDLRVGMVLKLPSDPTASAPIARPTPVPPKSAPSKPAPASTTTPTNSRQTTTNYTVKSGDTLTSIARKTVGDGNRWREIAQLNNLSNPGALRVGMVLKIPATASPSATSSPPAQAPPAPTPKPTTPTPKPPNIQAKTYQVQPGDSLIRIAQTTLGDGNRWREIAKLNNITNTRDIRVGQVLKLPPDATTTSAPPPESSAPQTYQVQPGDSLIRIAQTTLGDGNRWREIAKLNDITNARDIRIGQVLRIPSQSSAGGSTGSVESPTESPKVSANQTYTVQAGDSLIRIAQKTLGNGNRWREIAKLNNITNARDIRVGQVLKLPITAPSEKPSIGPLPGTAQLPPPPLVPGVPPPLEYPYTVQSGDNLYSIAEKTLGDRSRWMDISIFNGITDPSKLRVGQVLRIPGAETGALEVATVLNEAQGKQALRRETVRFVREQDNIVAQWLKQSRRDIVGVTYKNGLFRRGTQKSRNFIETSRSLLANQRLSHAEMNVIAAVSENEGYLDAVNTWDSQYLSFGMFQWTAGSPERPGELAELLTQLKQHYPNEFRHYFSQFGLDVDGTDGVRGWLSLQGTRLNSHAQKSLLRLPIWAYRFAIAGSDPIVQATEVFHAVTRLDKFYFVRQSSLDGFSLSRLITSELGVALLLDNHVNRPAYVAPGLAEALWQLGLSPQDLAQANTQQERQVIETYLTVRETYGSRPMSHARHRAGRIKRQMSDGKLSAERGSFSSNRSQRRG